jgi:hypothetical protein
MSSGGVRRAHDKPISLPGEVLVTGNCARSLGLGSCGVLALGALDPDLPEPLPRFFSDGAPRTHLVRRVHMGNILLWAVVGAVFVAAAVAILAV